MNSVVLALQVYDASASCWTATAAGLYFLTHLQPVPGCLLLLLPPLD